MSSGRRNTRPAAFGLAANGPARPPADRGRPELVAAIRAEIEQHGPITFARFMQRALYEPGLGYYATSADRPTRGGDFLTAPELHPLYGHALARQIDQAWRLLGEPDRFVVREYGAGNGTLALTILDGLRGMAAPSAPALRYQPIDQPGRLELVAARLAAAGHTDVVEQATGAPFVGCVLANEYLDALPVHRLRQVDGTLHELFVDWQDGDFVEREGPPSTPALAEWVAAGGSHPAEGQVLEVSPGVFDWAAEVGAVIDRGYAFVFDYGAEPAELYAPARAAGTLRAFRGQHVSSLPLTGVGEQDLTAHVDLAALRRAAGTAGLEHLGTTSQAEFLIGCGLEELLAAEQAALPEEWAPRLLLRSAVARLLDPRHLGGYAAVVLGRGVAADELLGLSYRLPRRT